jgi:hypothetical protein
MGVGGCLARQREAGDAPPEHPGSRQAIPAEGTTALAQLPCTLPCRLPRARARSPFQPTLPSRESIHPQFCSRWPKLQSPPPGALHPSRTKTARLESVAWPRLAYCPVPAKTHHPQPARQNACQKPVKATSLAAEPESRRLIAHSLTYPRICASGVGCAALLPRIPGAICPKVVLALIGKGRKVRFAARAPAFSARSNLDAALLLPRKAPQMSSDRSPAPPSDPPRPRRPRARRHITIRSAPLAAAENHRAPARARPGVNA